MAETKEATFEEKSSEDLVQAIEVLGRDKEASTVEVDVFLRLLANITKRILLEVPETNSESKAS